MNFISDWIFQKVTASDNGVVITRGIPRTDLSQALIKFVTV